MVGTIRGNVLNGARGVISVVLVGAVLALTPAVASAATPTELFISEYIEGSSFNKAVEIYNGTGGTVDLSTYSLELYSNGAATPSKTVGLSGSLADGDVFVITHDDANAAIAAAKDLFSPDVANFNGDDALVLRKGAAVVDSFGQVGTDPGSEWPGGGQNDTLRRKPAVCAGDTNLTDAFDASVEWETFAQDDSADLGAHSVTCTGGGGPADPVINEFSANTTGPDVEFVEVFGSPSTDYSAYTVLEIEGDSTTGRIDRTFPVGTTNATGYWTTAVGDLGIENGSITFLLVEGFTGTVGVDLDTNDDGTFDSTPWTSIADDVSVFDGGAGDLTYAATVLGPNYDGVSSFAPGGASRIPNGADTDTLTDWTRNDFDLFGIPTFGGSPAIGEAENTPDAINAAITTAIDPIGVCSNAATLIHEIQGAGLASPDVGSIREIEGVVVGDFQGATGLGGFMVQEEDADADSDSQTSEGIFVFDPATTVALDVGDVVRVRGTVVEFNGLTEINNVAAVLDCNVTGTASAATVTLPVTSVDDFEATEGMAVNFPQTLFASGNFTQARFGEVDLSFDGPLDNPTNVAAPGAAANAVNELNDRSRIQLDDGSTVQNPLPLPPYLGAGGTLRTGDSVAGLTAVMNYSFGRYELHPTTPVSFTRNNVRTGPPSVGGSLKVGAYNVLNYFTTVDGSGAICGPEGDQGCRGADTASELARQKDKIVAAISTLDADVLGLMEIENHPGDVPTADLVAGLNTATAAGTYDYVATGAVGADAIRVAAIYKPAVVTPVGPFAVLDSSVDPSFNDDKNRAVLAQSFVENSTGAVFTVAVNHLKSKGSNCNNLGDPDIGDEQGNCNVTRTTAAQAEVNWLATDPTGSGSGDYLIVGDLNAYAKEDPVTAIKAGGYTDLIESFVGSGFADGAYSFNFFSESGYLDHALVSSSLVSKVTGAGFWHVNADEPSGLDYNNFNQAGLYSPDEFRASDHDPVLVGLDLATPMLLKTSTVATLQALLPTGSSTDDNAINKAIDSIEDSLNPDYWADDSYLTKHGNKVFDEEKKAVKELDKVGGSASAAAQSVIDTLVSVDEELAQRAIDIAVTVGGKQSEINTALSEMTNAAADVAAGNPDKAIDHYKKAWEHATRAVENARFATFNASLNRFNEGDLAAELVSPGSAQPSVIAEIIQRNRPDVLLINEFDYDAGGAAATLFQNNYLSVSQGGADPINYPFRYTAPSNTGIPSGFDLDNSGGAGGPGDAFGFGFFPGQFGMVVYSMFPIDLDETRTFQNFLWKDMPGALLPEDPPGTSWYSADELEVFRLSSKSHWDLPLVVGDSTVHFLTSHPTPPVFDGPEDRNGTRNFDEIRFWADYVEGGATASYIYDDDGGTGGLDGSDRFVIAGDQNSDPNDGDSIPGAIQQLLNSPKVNTKVTPSSLGGPEQAAAQGNANTLHLSDPAFDTADFFDGFPPSPFGGAPGNLRVDYVLPRKNMKITSAGVFWPLSSDPLFGLVGTFPFPSSDHRLVYIDANVR